MSQLFPITPTLAQRLISQQFPEFAGLPVIEVEKQGHDNRTYRLGKDMLIRLPTTACYALKVPKEQELLPKLARHLTIRIPIPLKMGNPSQDFPFPFSVYKWLDGKSLNLLALEDDQLVQLAWDLSKFLKELHHIDSSFGSCPGQHNWWRGDHISVYDEEARNQITKLGGVIEEGKVLDLWERACKTKWNQPPVWVHGDFAVGNMLIKEGKLSAIIDFGGMGTGDPACDLVIAWTFLKGKAREIFVREMDLDENTWLRAKAWTLWKATFELCQIADQESPDADTHRRIIEEVL